MEQATMDAKEMFEAFAKDGLPLRNPASDLAGLYRAVAIGNCLEPLIYAGDELYIDYKATNPAHGDLVLFEWPDEVIEQWNASTRKKEWVCQFGGTADFTRGVKLLWRWPEDPRIPEKFREDWLVANDGLRRAKGFTLIGVVRAVVRAGVMLTV
jgi:hypothetical protein